MASLLQILFLLVEVQITPAAFAGSRAAELPLWVISGLASAFPKVRFTSADSIGQRNTF
jgi:hypothetical protein